MLTIRVEKKMLAYVIMKGMLNEHLLKKHVTNLHATRLKAVGMAVAEKVK